MTLRVSELPSRFRAAARARRLLGDRGTRAVYASPIAAPLRRMLVATAPAEPSLVEICGGALQGARMHVDLACEKFYWLGTHEEPVQRAILDCARAGDVAYDIGAHVGFFTLLLSRTVGSAGRVLAFEPQADNADRLARNIAVNDGANVDLNRSALADRAGMLAFKAHASTLEGSLAASSPTEVSATVSTTTIDAIVAAGSPSPAFMKIDVEGAEGAVLRGGRDTIAAHRPCMIIEIHSREAWDEVLDALPPYTFTDIDGTAHDASLRLPGHYLALPANGER